MIKETCLNDNKEIQPLIGENEMLNIRLQGLQQKRREKVEKYLKVLKIPDEMEIIGKILNEEEEENLYLKKGATEQKISIEALNNVLENQIDNRNNLERVRRKAIITKI